MTYDTFAALLNAPEIRSHVAPGVGFLQASSIFYSINNILLGDAEGAALFVYQGPGIYEGHYLIPAAYRAGAFVKCRSWLREVFTTYGGTCIFGVVPRDFRASRAMTRALGFRPTGTAETDCYGRQCVCYMLTGGQFLGKHI